MNTTKKIIFILTLIFIVYISINYFKEKNINANRKIDSKTTEVEPINKVSKVDGTPMKSNRIKTLSNKKEVEEVEEKKLSHIESYDLNDTDVMNPNAIKAYGSLFNSYNKEDAFINDKYDSDWSGETTNRIYNEILFDPDTGDSNFPSLDVESLLCKGSICKLEVRMNSENKDKNGMERSKLMYKLLYMNGGNPKNYTGLPSEFVPNRLIATNFFGENGYRYYISKGVNELKN